MAHEYKRRSAVGGLDSPAGMLESLISGDLGARSALHITPQEMLLEGKQMKRKLKDRLLQARLDGGTIKEERHKWRAGAQIDSKFMPSRDEELDDTSVGLKRCRDEDEPAVKSVSIKSATWLNKYLDNVDYIDNIQLERMAKAQAELQLRDEMGLSRRPQAFDPTWGRHEAHGEEAQKGLDVWNAMSPTLVTHRNALAVASSEYPHASWCLGHMCGMTCNPEGARQLKQAKLTEIKEARDAEAAAKSDFVNTRTGAAPSWGDEQQVQKHQTKLDKAISRGVNAAVSEKRRIAEEKMRKHLSTGPSCAIVPIAELEERKRQQAELEKITTRAASRPEMKYMPPGSLPPEFFGAAPPRPAAPPAANSEECEC